LCKSVRAGGLALGGNAPVRVQSMLSRPADDIPANIAQAKVLEAAGCEIIRAAVPNHAAVALIAALKTTCKVPIVADIHFDYKLALESVAAGADKIRINPGNIGDHARVKAVADACGQHSVPIRVGVNAGSLEAPLLAQYGKPTPEALVESAMRHVRMLERCDFDDIVVSIKSSDVQTMVRAYRLLAETCAYPLHLGVTEAGTTRVGLVKSGIGIGALLLDGIGDTIRVSLTASPEEEVKAAFLILESMRMLPDRPNIVSCPTCGRTKIDLIALTHQVERALADCRKNITVAVMGCAVNGPGEAREADVGLAGGDGCVLLFAKGKALRKVPENEALQALLQEIEHL
jgi:(E)-4-hydroxy-3-methylbut-2-enyl-diphosphate synthase